MSSQRMKIGDFLLRRLKEAGVRHLFGVPGDYNLELLQLLQDTGGLQWIGTCSELNASYAADGYARLNGLGAVLVTNGVGALSAINGVGGSYSEHIPVICVAGSIPLRSVERGLGMHHTMADGSYDHFLDAYAHVTAAHARLTPRNAATEIDRLILTAWREKRPVYMELPSDIAYLDIVVPPDPLTLADAPSDPERLRSCVVAIVGRLSSAKSPAILVDADADRFGVASELMGLAEKMQIPMAVINTAKSVIDETFPYYLGIYIGKPSEPHVREAIETSDCLLAIGYRPLEVTTGDFSASLPVDTIHARSHSVDVGDDNYQAVTLKEVLRGVIDAIPPVTGRAPRPVAPPVARPHADPSAKLTQAAYWQAMQGYIEQPPHDLLPLLQADKNVKLVDSNPLGNQYTFRPNHLQKPFDNPKIRQALWYAFNQKDFLDATIGNPEYYSTCKAMFVCGSPLASDKGMDGLLESNFERARALLKEANYDGTPIVLMHSTDLQVLTNLAPVAKSLMERAGFKVDMQSMDWQTLVARRAKKDPANAGGWHAFLTAWVSADILNPVMTALLNSSCDKAIFGWPCDEEMEKLRDAFTRETDPVKQKAIAEAIQVRNTQVTTHIHLGQFYQPVAVRKGIDGIPTAPVPVLWNVSKK